MFRVTNDPGLYVDSEGTSLEEWLLYKPAPLLIPSLCRSVCQRVTHTLLLMQAKLPTNTKTILDQSDDSRDNRATDRHSIRVRLDDYGQELAMTATSAPLAGCSRLVVSSVPG